MWGEAQEGRDVYIVMTELCGCRAEASTTLYSNYLPIKNKLKKEKENYNEVSSQISQNGHHQKINGGEGVEKREPSNNVGRNVKWYSHCGE